MTSRYTIEGLREEIMLARESHPAKICELEKISASLNIAIKQVPPINVAVCAVWENTTFSEVLTVAKKMDERLSLPNATRATEGTSVIVGEGLGSA